MTTRSTLGEWVEYALDTALDAVQTYPPEGLRPEDVAAYITANRPALYSDPEVWGQAETLVRSALQAVMELIAANRPLVNEIVNQVAEEALERWQRAGSPGATPPTASAVQAWLDVNPLELEGEGLFNTLQTFRVLWNNVIERVHKQGLKIRKPKASTAPRTRSEEELLATQRAAALEATRLRGLNRIEEAQGIGFRVAEYNRAVAEGTPKRLAQARRLWYELNDNLAGWARVHGNPHDHAVIVTAARTSAGPGPRASQTPTDAALKAFLGAFAPSGVPAAPFGGTIPERLMQFPVEYAIEAVKASIAAGMGPDSFALDLVSWLCEARGCVSIEAFVSQWPATPADGPTFPSVSDALSAIWRHTPVESSWRFAVSESGARGIGSAGLIMPYDKYYTGPILRRRDTVNAVIAIVENEHLPDTAWAETVYNLVGANKPEDKDYPTQRSEFDAITVEETGEAVMLQLTARDTYIPEDVITAWLNARVQVSFGADRRTGRGTGADGADVLTRLRLGWQAVTKAEIPEEWIAEVNDSYSTAHPWDNRWVQFWDPRDKTRGAHLSHIEAFNERDDKAVRPGGYSPVRLRFHRTMYGATVSYARHHKIESGETLASIAAKHATTEEELRNENPKLYTVGADHEYSWQIPRDPVTGNQLPAGALRPGDQLLVFTPIPYAIFANRASWETAFRSMISERVRLFLCWVNSDYAQGAFDPSSYTNAGMLKAVYGDTWEAFPWAVGEAVVDSILGKVFAPGHAWTLRDLVDLAKEVGWNSRSTAEQQRVAGLLPGVSAADLPSKVRTLGSYIRATRKDDRRKDYEAAFTDSLRAFLKTNEALRNSTAAAYNRAWRSYRNPTYSGDPLTDKLERASRMTKGAEGPNKVVPYAEQNEGARRLLAEGGGLLAYQVGVGKTMTALLTMAKARQNGSAQRVVISCPNSLAAQWQKRIQAYFPDYRTTIIGTKARKLKTLKRLGPNNHLRLRAKAIAERLFLPTLDRVRAAYKAGADVVQGTQDTDLSVPFGDRAVMGVSAETRNAAFNRMASELARADGEHLVLNGGSYRGSYGGTTQLQTFMVEGAPPQPRDETATEMADKWLEFKHGRYDAVVVPRSRLSDPALDRDFVRKYALNSTAIIRNVEDTLYKSQTVEGPNNTTAKRGFTEGWVLRQKLVTAAQALAVQDSATTALADELDEPSHLAGAVRYVSSHNGYLTSHSWPEWPEDHRTASAWAGKPVVVIEDRTTGEYSMQGQMKPDSGSSWRDLRVSFDKPRVNALMFARAPFLINRQWDKDELRDRKINGNELYVHFTQEMELQDADILGETKISPTKPRFVLIEGEIVPVVSRAAGSNRMRVFRLPNEAVTQIWPSANEQLVGTVPPTVDRPSGTTVLGLNAPVVTSPDPSITLAAYVKDLNEHLNDKHPNFRVDGVLEWVYAQIKPDRAATDTKLAAMYEQAFLGPADYTVVTEDGAVVVLATAPPPAVPRSTNYVARNDPKGLRNPPHLLIYRNDARFRSCVFVEGGRNMYPDGVVVPPRFGRSGASKPIGAKTNGAYFVLGYPITEEGAPGTDPVRRVLTAEQAARNVLQALDAGVVTATEPGPYHIVRSDPIADFTTETGELFSTSGNAGSEARRLSKLPKAPITSSDGTEVEWLNLGVDLLIVDEAHAYKGLFTPAKRGSLGGGQVEFLSLQGASSQAWRMLFQCAAVRANGGRVVELTATPATASPIEFYNMMAYLGTPGDADVTPFSAVGITDPEQFVNRYIDVGKDIVAKGSGTPEEALVARFRPENKEEFQQVFKRFANRKGVEDVPALRGEIVMEGLGAKFSREEDGQGRLHGVFELPVPDAQPGDRLMIKSGVGTGDYAISAVLPNGHLRTMQPFPDAKDAEGVSPTWGVYRGGRVPLAPPSRAYVGLSVEQHLMYRAFQGRLTNGASGTDSALSLMGSMHTMGQIATHYGLTTLTDRTSFPFPLFRGNAADAKKKKQKVAGDRYLRALQAALPLGPVGPGGVPILARATPTSVGADTPQPFKELPQDAASGVPDGRSDSLRTRRIEVLLEDGEKEARYIVPAPLYVDAPDFPPGKLVGIVMSDPYTVAEVQQRMEAVIAFRPGRGAKGLFLAVFRGIVRAHDVRDWRERALERWTSAVEHGRTAQVSHPSWLVSAEIAEVILTQHGYEDVEGPDGFPLLPSVVAAYTDPRLDKDLHKAGVLAMEQLAAASLLGKRDPRGEGRITERDLQNAGVSPAQRVAALELHEAIRKAGAGKWIEPKPAPDLIVY